MAEETPWTNCRLSLASELDDDADLPSGVVGRLYYTEASHPAVKQSFQALVPQKLSVGALALQHVINKRGPDALIGCIPGSRNWHRDRLAALCEQCHARGEVLVHETPTVDVVLVPRVPSIADGDGLFFMAFATNTRAVRLCEELRAEGRVAVVLDMDNTLVDAASVSIPSSDWDLLDWTECAISTSSGRRLGARYAPLGGEDDLCESSWVLHWVTQGAEVTLLLRVRKGWADLKACLLARRERFVPFVCTKGKREYVQLLLRVLDPDQELFPASEIDARVTSTFPDNVPHAAPKTALSALGCAPVLHARAVAQLAAPLIAVDDSAEAYLPEYAANVLFVEEYSPSQFGVGDSGNVLRQAARRLRAFWHAAAADDGGFAWQAAQAFSTALVGAAARTAMESPAALVYLQTRCRRQGDALWHQFTVRGVFGDDAVVRDLGGDFGAGRRGSFDARGPSGDPRALDLDPPALDPPVPVPEESARPPAIATGSGAGPTVLPGRRIVGYGANAPASSPGRARPDQAASVAIAAKAGEATPSSPISAHALAVSASRRSVLGSSLQEGDRLSEDAAGTPTTDGGGRTPTCSAPHEHPLAAF